MIAVVFDGMAATVNDAFKQVLFFEVHGVTPGVTGTTVPNVHSRHQLVELNKRV